MPELRLIPDQPAAAVIARDRAVISPSYTRSYPFVMERAIGLVVEDPDGNRFLDLNGGRCDSRAA